MGKFKITVTDMVTDKVLVDSETNVIIGAYLSEDQTGSHQMVFAKDNSKNITFCIMNAENVCHKLCLEDRDIGMTYLALRAIAKELDNEEEDE